MPKLDKQSGPSGNGKRSQLSVLSYSTCLVEAVTGPGQRGLIHSVFRAAANILFPNGFLLSLNALDAPRLPNSLQLSSPTAAFPFTDLRIGQPVLLGAARLNIEALSMSLDLTYSTQWNPKISRPDQLNLAVLAKNAQWLAEYVATHPLGPVQLTHAGFSRGEASGSCVGTGGCGDEAVGALCLSWSGSAISKRTSTRPPPPPPRPPLVPTHLSPLSKYLLLADNLDLLEMAHLLCGRGPGLTPSGDDILAGWIAINWLLHGPQPHLLAAYQQILALAERQTHLLSQCWLRYAADGYVAEPIGILLQALIHENEEELREATRAVLALGATSGLDVIHGILLGLAGIPQLQLIINEPGKL